MREAIIHLGPFSVHLFGVFIALGMLAGIYVVQKEAERKGLDVDQVFNLALLGMVAGIVGARIYYVLVFNPTYYLNNPGQILMVHTGGLSIQGGLLGAILFGVAYTKYYKISFWKVADAFGPAIILGQAIARVGCDVFGIPMANSRFWGVMLDNQLVHPVQIYESLLNYGLFLILWNYRDKIKYDGQLFVFYLIGFSINRAIIEFFRTNPIVVGQFTVAHVTSLLLIIVTAGLGLYLKKNKLPAKEELIDKSEKIRDNFVVIGLMILSVVIYYSLY
ncbi:prolipoprotein diacylglyceryl transferase [Natroniella sulfidigena]|uniref:prolipoprotein diacylglyceryl transferase n=1 Tax=Natroniella sulfidigena TaxID=723921 RepID=UPI002009F3E0|nr:prolipoprotein diacylglyceryl transferase [Natroniella sulfidigena]MCK8816831.1 prolipoprotein diacylglyceryl transferase [Natroniella sulfidigena]